MSERGESLELACLRALKVGAEAGPTALRAASIVVHAYAVARAAPEARADALRIVELARQVYAERPTRASLTAAVDEALDEIEAAWPGRRAWARDRLVDRVLDHLGRGTGRGPA